MKVIYSHYKMGPHSLHGPDHWLRVGVIGLRLADLTGANKKIVRYFAQLHDIGRTTDDSDLYHGLESARFCKQHRGSIDLSDAEFKKLIFAIAKHPMGKTCDDVDIGVCWDADRCDLGRVGISPDLAYFSTKQAKEKSFSDWAFELHLNSDKLI